MSTAQSLWDKAWAKESEGIDLTFARVGGRTSKAFPNRENIDFILVCGCSIGSSDICISNDWKTHHLITGVAV